MELFITDPINGDYSILMAIVDFLPVIFYFLAAWLIANDLYPHVNKTTYGFLAAGSLMCFIGGAFKALWKLLFCFGINYPAFFTSFFPMQAPGFILYFVGIIMAMKQLKAVKTSDTVNMITATTVTSSAPLLAFQSIGSVGSLICLSILGFRTKNAQAGAFFILSIIFLFGMVGLSATIDSSLSWANWVEQGVNTLGQVFFYLGARKMHKKGYMS